MSEEKMLEQDLIFIVMMLIGVLGLVFAYPREIMDFLVYSIKVIADTKLIQIIMMAIGFGGFVFFIFHRMLHWRT